MEKTKVDLLSIWQALQHVPSQNPRGKEKHSTSVRLNLEVQIKMLFIVHRQTSSEKYGIFHMVQKHIMIFRHTSSKIMKLKIIFQEIYRSLFFPLLIPAQWQYMPNKSLIIQILSEKFLHVFL